MSNPNQPKGPTKNIAIIITPQTFPKSHRLFNQFGDAVLEEAIAYVEKNNLPSLTIPAIGASIFRRRAAELIEQAQAIEADAQKVARGLGVEFDTMDVLVDRPPTPPNATA